MKRRVKNFDVPVRAARDDIDVDGFLKKFVDPMNDGS
jgi:hypothetical protein